MESLKNLAKAVFLGGMGMFLFVVSQHWTGDHTTVVLDLVRLLLLFAVPGLVLAAFLYAMGARYVYRKREMDREADLAMAEFYKTRGRTLGRAAGPPPAALPDMGGQVIDPVDVPVVAVPTGPGEAADGW